MAVPVVAIPQPARQDVSAEDLAKTLKRYRTYLLADRGVRPATADVYMRMLRKILVDLGTTAPDIDDLRERVASMREGGYSHTYVVNTCRVIECYAASVGRQIRLGRGRRRPAAPVQALSEGEVAVILAACRDVRERAVISILAYSGMRNDELGRLRVQDVLVDTQQIRIRSGKGGRGRTVRVSGRCIADVQAYLAEFMRRDDALLFTSLRQGRSMEGASVRRLVRRVVARTMIQKRVHPHLFRHSLACNMLTRGASLFAIRDQLGHSDIETTMIYLRSVDSRAAANYEMFCPSYS